MLKFKLISLCKFLYHVLNNIKYSPTVLENLDYNLNQASRVLGETKETF